MIQVKQLYFYYLHSRGRSAECPWGKGAWREWKGIKDLMWSGISDIPQGNETQLVMRGVRRRGRQGLAGWEGSWALGRRIWGQGTRPTPGQLGAAPWQGELGASAGQGDHRGTKAFIQIVAVTPPWPLSCPCVWLCLLWGCPEAPGDTVTTWHGGTSLLSVWVCFLKVLQEQPQKLTEITSPLLNMCKSPKE